MTTYRSSQFPAAVFMQISGGASALPELLWIPMFVTVLFWQHLEMLVYYADNVDSQETRRRLVARATLIHLPNRAHSIVLGPESEPIMINQPFSHL
jgi:hypothetical protein